MQAKTSALKLNALTGLRFFAAAAIVIHHVRDFGFPRDFAGSWLLNNGVAFFFVLSGFILAYVYPTLDAPGATRRFWIARFARIWPGHIAALILAYLLLGGDPSSYGTGQNTPVLWLANVFLVHAWIPLDQFFFSYNSVSWSISTEAFFYLAFPLILPLFARTWRWKLGLTLVIVVTLVVICRGMDLPVLTAPGAGLTLNGLICFNPVGRIYEFVLGMCTALAWRTIQPNAALSKTAGTAVEIGALSLLFAMGTAARPIGDWADANLGPAAAQWFNQGGTLSLGFAAMILVMALERGWVSAILGSRVGVFLGEISFMIYMTHQLLIRGYLKRIEWFTAWSNTEKFALYIVLVIAVSALIWRFIEMPARKALVSRFAA